MARPPFSILVGPDSRLLRLRLDALLGGHPPEKNASWQRFVFWADEGLSPSFWEHLTLQGLFATPKALVVRNAEALPIAVLRTVSEALLKLVPSPLNAPLPSALSWPVLCLETGFDKGRPKIAPHVAKLACYAAAEKYGWLDITPPLSGKALTVYINNEARRLGLQLTAGQADVLAQALPADAAAISAEMEKLALGADENGRPAADMVALVSQPQELSIFELLRAVQQQGKAPAAWKRILEDRLSGENMVFAFTSLLLREARTFWQILAGQPPYLPAQAAAQKKAAAQSLGFAGVARLWDLALAADKGIKSGERSPDQAFEMLAADLFVLFASKTRR